MKHLDFSFKRESFWMLAFAIAPAVLGLLIMLFVIVLK